MEVLNIFPPDNVPPEIEIELERSKSISNRVLLIRALSPASFEIHKLSNARDTTQFARMLETPPSGELDGGDGGTTYRFMMAYLALQSAECILTAGKSMSKRPIGPLVDALRTLGARIDYINQEGYPPLSFNGGPLEGGKIQISAGQSSQFISALMMIGPYLEKGLHITLDDPPVSLPYLKMTAALMQQFGAKIKMELPYISIQKSEYTYPKDAFTVESDWSAASYFWAHASLLPVLKMQLNGLFENSLQGDSVIAKWAAQQGFSTSFNSKGLHLEKTKNFKPQLSGSLNLQEQPDLAQTVLAFYAQLKLPIQISGLQTLFHKETDRLKAMQQELLKVGCELQYSSAGDARLLHCADECNWPVQFETYSDHRMAMALSLFAKNGHTQIRNAEVVRKSFPGFWKELGKLGFIFQTPPLREKAP